MKKKPMVHIPRSLTQIQRTAICVDGERLCVMLCGSLPTLMSRLMFKENVLLYSVHTATELKKALLDENGVPPDLVIVEAHAMAGLPRMSFFAPADNHESEVVFMPDVFPSDEKRFEEIYALIGQMLEEKRQRVEILWEQARAECKNKESPVGEERNRQGTDWK